VELFAGLDELNDNNAYSPLKSAGKWTLIVKMYRAPSQMIGFNERGGGRGPAANNAAKMFEAIGKQAEGLAKLMRHPQLNFESYVIHTNHASLVTVGLFESEKDPRLLNMQATLAKLRLDPEQLMSPPLPIQVPKGR
jgi:hypothetical protein